ncbi:MAG: tetratricopeptide repeat protein [Bryobacteraceae bacterium]|nr:tetratricopeptide repeat protein [Bryobacterales bacterium]MEB2360118.1 tetratricopeptide repeat protein [Bryobacterales bacterium]NUN00525.1 tetratricopeptide repeat protein [Bryobacteraceae bacterium]
MKKCVTLLFAAVLFLQAQHNHHESTHQKPVKLLEGLGDHTHPIATNSQMAQKFFDQGLALVFGFNHDEAARLFARAAELDPKSPMPHWGIALALGPNYNMPPMPEREEKAWQAIEKAIELTKRAPENERAYVNALVKRYSRSPEEDRKQLAVHYKDAMKEVMKRYPDDLDAATLYAEALMNLRPWQLWSKDGVPAEGTLEILEVLEGVLRRDPSHPGANHYYIHAVEASKNPERALPSAMRLGSLMPGAGHMVHMPSHIFLRVGDFEQSAVVNETASEVDRKYIERSGAKGIYPLMYYSHNLHFVSYVRMLQGRFEQALDYSKRLRKNVDGAIDGMPMLGTYGAFEWLVLARFAKWKEMLAEPEPGEKHPFVHAMYRYSRGLAFAGLGNVPEAEAERERMGALCARIPESEMLMVNTMRSVLDVGMADLDARIARAKKDSASEVTHFRRAAGFEDRLNYMEPPDWYYPVREALGGALLRQGKAAEAEEVFRRDLELHPRNGRSLFGLMEAMKMQKRQVSVDWIQKEFQEAWRGSPLTLKVADL